MTVCVRHVIISRESDAMIQLLVIADDLTGSIDTGVQFARQGLVTLVTLEPGPDFGSMPPDLQVLVADTESRHLNPGEAARRVMAIVGSARKHGIDSFYKKTDSTLRGNLGAELEAALSASGRRKLCFIPAFPGARRFTRQGIHYIGDKPLHLTRFGSDPLEPVKTSSITAILAEQSGRRTETVGAAKLRFPEAWAKSGAEFLVFDCESDSDLEEIGTTLRDLGLLGLTAGSAGFAGVLPGLLGLPRRQPETVRPRGPLLVLNGSLNRSSLEQADYAKKRGVKSFVIPLEMLLAPPGDTAPEAGRMADTLAAEAAAGRDVLLRSLASGESPDHLFKENTQHQDIKALCLRVSLNLGKITAAVLAKSDFGSLAVFGGDTLIGVLEALSVTGIRPLAEIEPGIAVSRFAGGSRDLPLISKAGGFGDEDIILRLIDYTRGA